MQAFLIFVAGVIFAVGLGISGMTDANKVIGSSTCRAAGIRRSRS